jgi:hypothetical protein
VSTSARIDRFRIWLWSNGTSEDIAMFEPAIVETILAIAGRSPVSFAHVTAACRRAREAGKDPKPTEALGHADQVRTRVQPAHQRQIARHGPGRVRLRALEHHRLALQLLEHRRGAPPVAVQRQVARGERVDADEHDRRS